MMNTEVQRYQFDDVEVAPLAFTASKAGAALALEPKSFRVLVYLIENRDRAVTKDEILAAVWPDTAVTDNALARVIAQLRRELGDDARQPRYIQTIPTVGYRFVAELTEFAKTVAAPQPAPPAARVGATWPRWVAAAALVVGAAGIWYVSRRSEPAGASWRATGPPRQLTTSPGYDQGPAFSPDGRSLAYASDRSGVFEIYVRPVDGARETQLTADGGQNVQPAWSPDGASIAFHSAGRGGIWVMSAGGGTPRQIVRTGSHPRWSPDGKRIAYRSDDLYSLSVMDTVGAVRNEIRSVPLEGGSPSVLIANPSVENRGVVFAFSPDGKRLAYSPAAGRTGELWLANADGSNPRKIHQSENLVFHAPVFTPDGRSLYFTSAAKQGDIGVWTIPVEPAGEPRQVVWTGNGIPRDISVSPDGKTLAYTLSMPQSQIWQLAVGRDGRPAGEPRPLYEDVVFRVSFTAFSPDASRIAFFARTFGGAGNVWVMNADGSGAAPLTASPAHDMLASWTPDGRSVIYTRGTAFGTMRGVQVWRASVDDRSERPLYEAREAMTWPRLAPNGRDLIYHKFRDGVMNLYTSDLSGGEERQLTRDGEGAGFGSWSPDGEWIAYELIRGEDTHLAVLDRAGRSKVLLAEKGQTWPFGWSPDSRRILYAGFRGGAWGVWWMDRATRETRRLTGTKSLAAYVRYPSWSPKGDRVIYERTATRGNIYLLKLK